MTPAVILAAVLQYGPSILPLVQQLTAMIRDRKPEVTPEDIAQLIELGRKSSADYLTAAGGAPALSLSNGPAQPSERVAVR